MYKANDFIYDGVSISEYVIVEDIRRSLSSEIVSYGKDVPGRHGALHRVTRRGSKFIEVDIRIIEDKRDDVVDIIDRLNEDLIKDEPKKLKLRDLPGKYELAILDGSIPIERKYNTGFITLTFFNPYGISFSDEISIGTTNNGNTDTDWTLTGEINGSLVTILNEDTLDKITIETSMISNGKTLKYDSEWEHVFVSNEISMHLLYVESDNFMLSPGENNIRVVGLENAVFEHRARWL